MNNIQKATAVLCVLLFIIVIFGCLVATPVPARQALGIVGDVIETNQMAAETDLNNSEAELNDSRANMFLAESEKTRAEGEVKAMTMSVMVANFLVAVWGIIGPFAMPVAFIVGIVIGAAGASGFAYHAGYKNGSVNETVKMPEPEVVGG